MATIGPKEAAQRALRLARATTRKVTVQAPPLAETHETGGSAIPARPFLKPAPPAKPRKEPAVKKTAKPKAKKGKKAAPKKARKVKSKRPAKKAPRQRAEAPQGAGKRPDGLRVGSKEGQMLDLVLGAGTAGITEAAICKELGWVRCRVTLTRVCAKVGATLTSTGQGTERRWSATMPEAKPAGGPDAVA